MAFLLMKNRVKDQNLSEFKILLAYQHYIQNIDCYFDYSKYMVYNEICQILRKDEFYQKTFNLKNVISFYF